ncbi:MAG: peptidylprolyl isomerase [Chloroflexi bacterium]|nr:peptidylprolyl isomerase [Chloroflexota bacterium]
MAILTAVAVVAVVVAVVITGYTRNLAGPLRQPVGQVNDVIITMGEYVKRLRVYELGTRASGQQPDYSQIPFTLVFGMQDEELMRQGAPRFGVRVTPAEVEKELRTRVLALQGRSESPESIDAAHFKELYAQFLSELKLRDQEYRRVVEADVLRARLKDFLAQDPKQVPVVAEQVHLRAIRIGQAQEGQQPVRPEAVIDRWRRGEDFARLAAELSDHPSARDGGDLGFKPRHVLPEEVDQVAFAAPSGPIYTPVVTAGGTWIIEVLAREENRRVSKEDFEVLKEFALTNWLQEQRRAEYNTVKLFWDSDRYQFAVEQARKIRKT